MATTGARGRTPDDQSESSPQAVREDLNRGRQEMRGIGAETADITRELRELARLELDLAKTEMAENRQRLVVGSGAGVAAGVFGFWILGFLGIAMMLGLMEVWPGWAAALVTAAAWLILAGIAAFVARSRFQQFSPTPKRAMASMKEDVTWARGLMKQSSASASSGR